MDPRQAEIELTPARASALITVAKAERMYATLNLSYPVSGTATALTQLAEFKRSARLLMEGMP